MLNWIKRVFAKPELEKPKILSIEQMHHWLSEQLREKENKFRSLRIEHNNQIKKYKEDIGQRVVVLKKSELKNQNIPERAMQLMQGNREEYCKQIIFFAENLPEPDSYQDINDYFIKTEHLLQELSKKTAKSFAIMQEFFSNESRQVHGFVGLIEKSMSEFKNAVERAKINLIKQTQETAQAYTTRHAQKIGLQTAITKSEEELKEMRKTMLDLHKEKAKFESDPQRLTLLEKIEEAQKQVKEQEQKIRDLFSVLNPAFKRFFKIATRHKKTIEAYVEDSVNAISHDLHLDVVEVFKDLQRVIEFNRLDLKEKLTQKVEGLLEKTDKYKIGMLQRELGVRMKAFRELEAKLNELNATKMLDRAQKLITEQSSQEKELTRGIEKLHRDLTRLDLEEIKDKLERQINEISDSQITLTP